MAAIVYHGLQSHLEPQIVESRTIRLRLPSPKPVPSQSIDLAFKTCFWDSNSNSNIKTNQEKNKPTPSSSNTNRSWNFLDSLSQETKQQKETTYVHPQQRRSSLALSPKSLEICTENLGNESGTDIVENSIDDMLSSSSSSSLGTREQNQRQGYRVLAAKKEKTQNFPPPLTTIRGSESLRVRPHREDGRLVIEVTKVPQSASCFQAERSDGRLRLCFSTNQDTSFDHPQEEEYDNIDENEPTNNEDEEEYDNMDGNEPTSNEGFDEEYYDEEMSAEIVDDEEEEEEETEEKVEVLEEYDDVRMDKYGRPRRCNEGGGDHHRENNELLNWGERLWVANC